MNNAFLIILSLSTTIPCPAQLQKNDTILYLRFQPDYDLKCMYSQDKKDGSQNRIVITYSFNSASGIYNGYSLQLKSTASPPRILKTKKIKHAFAVDSHDLANFIKDNYPERVVGFSGKPYFDKLRHIYVLEDTPFKGLTAIVEVVIDVQIIDE